MLGKRLKELRGKHTQEEVAQFLGISRARYSHYENERSDPDNDMLKKIADFFGVSIDYLIGRAETSDFTAKEEDFLNDINHLSIEELMDKHILTVDGKPATKEEIKATIAFIRSLRGLD